MASFRFRFMSVVATLLRYAALSALAGIATACAHTALQNQITPVRQVESTFIVDRPLEDLYDHIIVKTGTKAPWEAASTQPSREVPRTTVIEELAGELAHKDVVFVGEFHTHPALHFFEMRLLRELHRLRDDMSLSMEQFERDTQTLMDAYLDGTIGEEPLIADARAWPNYRSDYRPLIEYAKQQNLPVIAANAPHEIVRCVGRMGMEFLESLPPGERAWVAHEFYLDDGPYKDRFVAASQMHGRKQDMGETGSQARAKLIERSFAAQVTRDDTMAGSIARHLNQRPTRLTLHICGSFHSAAYLGTVERLHRRRPDLEIAVITPVAVAAGEAPAFAASDLEEGDYLLLVRSLPERYLDEERERKDMEKLFSESQEKPCPPE